MNSIAALLSAGLMLTTGAGVVIACTSLAGNQGNNGQGNDGRGNNGNGNNSIGSLLNDTYRGTNFNDPRNASFCEYNQPITRVFYYPTRHGVLVVTVTFFCGRIHVHVQFDPDRGFRLTGFYYRWGNGPANNCSGSSYDADAPNNGANYVTVGADGGTYNVPFSQ